MQKRFFKLLFFEPVLTLDLDLHHHRRRPETDLDPR